MARSIFEQTGWKRPHAATLLMDTETLKLVTEYATSATKGLKSTPAGAAV